MNSKVILISGLTMMLSTSALAVGGGEQWLSTGVVFPSLNGAVRLDAAGLPYQHGTALLLEAVPPGSNSPGNYNANLAYGSGDFGGSVGYDVVSTNAGNNGSLQVAGGVKWSNLSVGISSVPASGAFTNFYASAEINTSSGLRFGLSTALADSAANTMTLGLGYREENKFSIEGGILSPFLTKIFSPGANPLGYVSLAVFPGSLGAAMGLYSPFNNANIGLSSFSLLWNGWTKTKLHAIWNPPSLPITTSAAGTFAVGLTLVLQ